MIRLWYKLVRFGFNLLYHQLARSYDCLSRTVSKGEWRRWQQAVIPRLRGRLILDLGCGTGDLLLDLAVQGYRPWGVDVSVRMLTLAAKKTQGRLIQLNQARAQALPLASDSFDSVTVTFPADFIDDARTLSELWRVIAPGGRLIIADGGRLLGTDPLSRTFDWLFRITSHPEAGCHARDALTEAGFRVTREEIRYPRSTVLLIIAEKAPSTDLLAYRPQM